MHIKNFSKQVWRWFFRTLLTKASRLSSRVDPFRIIFSWLRSFFRGYDRETGTPKCALKLDLHEAFDSVDWRFIISILLKFNFPILFVNWIKILYIYYYVFLLKWMGSFQVTSKALKDWGQGDPLSPYLFTIFMNALSILLDNKPSSF